MRKIIFTFIFFACLANVSAQFKVNSDGSFEAKISIFRAAWTGNNSTDSNVSFGALALPSNSSGSYNTGLGHQALRVSSTGSANTSVGHQSLYRNTTGGYNTAVGRGTLSTNTTGAGNTGLGSGADVLNSNQSWSIAIGFGSIVNSSFKAVIGTAEITSVGGYGNWANFSDVRGKKNIQTKVPGLDFIKLLQPVTYNLDLKMIDELQKSDDPELNARRDSLFTSLSPEMKETLAKARTDREQQVQSGFIAQDVEKAARSIGYDFSGVDVPSDSKGTYGLRYAEFVVPLVKAVQELSEQNELLQQQINELSEIVYKLQDNSGANLFRSESITTSVSELPNEVAYLYQNVPNPFTEQATIQYFLPDNIRSAYVCIFDMKGNMLKKLDAPTGENMLIIDGFDLTAGTYLYTLIADGKKVDTKRMILTK